jgi:DNA-directed RNA polymerase specialized sigma24 family protein
VPKSRLDRMLAPWVFVLTGIVFNILSALITHYFIGVNNDAINLIDRDINRKQVLIDSLWQSRVEVERKKEFFILLFAQPGDKSAASEAFYRDYLHETISAFDLTEFDPPDATEVLRLTIDDIVNTLPEIHQRIIHLRIDGFEIGEITAQVPVSRRTVERVLQSFRVKLRSTLDFK